MILQEDEYVVSAESVQVPPPEKEPPAPLSEKETVPVGADFAPLPVSVTTTV